MSMRAKQMKAERASTIQLLLSSLSIILLLCCTNASAQDQKAPDRGFTPGGSYALGDIETINTTNGNLMLNIPVAALPPGRGGLAAKISLFYNSKLYDPRTIYRNCARTPYGAPMAPEEPAGPRCIDDSRTRAVIVGRNTEVGGWRYGYKYKLELQGRDYSPPTQTSTSYYDPCQEYDYLYYFKLFVIFPDGSKHEFRLLDKDDRDGYYKYRPDGATNAWNPDTNQGYCPSDAPLNTKMVYYSVDGSYARLEFEQDGNYNDWSNNPWTLYLPDGTRVTGGNSPQRITDRNGNYIEIQERVPYNSNLADKIVDQLGRSIAIEHDSATGDDRIHQWGTGGLEIVTTVKWKTIQVSKNYNAGGGSTTTTLNPTFHVIDQIILPQQSGGLSYTFGYNAGTSSSSGWGELSSVTLPSGASTAYSYKLDAQTGSTITAMDVINNSPTQKVLTYRLEYDGVAQSNTPCAQGSANCATEIWTYSIPDSQEGGTTTITGPDGGVTKESFYGGTSSVYKSVRADGTVIERQWMNNVAYTAGTAVQDVNTYFKAELTSIVDAQGTLVKTAVKDYQYDKNGNLLRVRESDWQNYSLLHDGNGEPVWGNVANVQFVRTTLNTYYLDAPEASESSATDPRNANVYNRATAPRLLNVVKSTEIRDGSEDGTQISRTEFIYDNPSTTGNLMEQKSWDSAKGVYSNPLSQTNSISVAQQYDSYGNVTLKTDARGSQTKYTYGPINGFVDLYPTKTEVAYGTALKRTSMQEYDFSTGAVTKSTDVDNNNISTSTQYDVFGRPILVKAADGTTLETHTVTDYSDSAGRVITRSDLSTMGDGKLVGIKHYDPLGRLRLARQLEDASTESETDETKGIKVQTRYVIDAVNHCSYQLVSNPYRAATSSEAATPSASDPQPNMG